MSTDPNQTWGAFFKRALPYVIGLLIFAALCYGIGHYDLTHPVSQVVS